MPKHQDSHRPFEKKRSDNEVSYVSNVVSMCTCSPGCCSCEKVKREGKGGEGEGK